MVSYRSLPTPMLDQQKLTSSCDAGSGALPDFLLQKGHPGFRLRTVFVYGSAIRALVGSYIYVYVILKKMCLTRHYPH